ncbi:OFA family MFS transporter [Lachnospiraceae bacterium ZAX-1]
MNFEKKRIKCLLAAMLLGLCTGIGYAWSVFQTPLMKNFEWQLSAISLTFTIQVLISTISPVFLGKFQKKIGVANYLRIGIIVYALGLLATRFTSSIGYLYVIYGLVVGAGMGMLYPTLVAYSTSLFPEKTGMAAGILACAYGSGAVVWAPLATLLMRQFSVLEVFSFLAVLFVVVMFPVSFLIKEPPAGFHPKPQKEKKEKSSTAPTVDFVWKEMLKTPKFYILVISLTLGATSGLMITGHASNIMQEVLSFTPETAALLVGLISIFNAAGRLIYGAVSDRIGRYNMMMILFAVIGCAMLLLTQSGGVVFMVALLAISSSYGGFTAMISPVCADNFGLKNLAVNYTFFYISYGLAGVIGPQLASIIKTASGGYNNAFLTVAGMSVGGFLLVLSLKLKKAHVIVDNASLDADS